jgi:hypothetical protein
MEFLRFGSSIPGAFMSGGGGCCAAEIIQDFRQDPNELASIEMVSGDGGEPLGDQFLGKTWKEIFEARMKVGTFYDEAMPNHAFLAILTESQIWGGYGLEWLKILKENGFEFIRAFDNSVYSTSSLAEDCIEEGEEEDWIESHPNYLFGCFRNIGGGRLADPFQPPRQWLEIGGGVMETSECLDATSRACLQQSRDGVHTAQWRRIGEVPFYSRSQLEADGVPIWLAGTRSQDRQEPAQIREERHKSQGVKSKAAPF